MNFAEWLIRVEVEKPEARSVTGALLGVALPVSHLFDPLATVVFDPKVLAKPFRPFVVHGLAGVPETAVKLAIGVINSAISVGIGALSLAAIENVSGIKFLPAEYLAVAYPTLETVGWITDHCAPFLGEALKHLGLPVNDYYLATMNLALARESVRAIGLIFANENDLSRRDSEVVSSDYQQEPHQSQWS